MPYIEVAADVEIYYEIQLFPRTTNPRPGPTTINEGKSEKHHDPKNHDDNDDHDGSETVKPWLMILHPMFLDLTFTRAYTEPNTVLSQKFNIISIDSRSHGRTKSKASATCDLWTHAADLAIVLIKLQLDHVHIFASDAMQAEIVLRLTALFPNLVASLCLGTLPPGKENGFVQTAFLELLASWTNPELPEDWEASVSATQWWHYGPRSARDPKIQDAWAGVMIRRYPPCNAARALGTCVTYIDRRLPPACLATSITVPVLVLHGDYENLYDVPTSRERFLSFVNVPSLSAFKVLEGAPLAVFHAESQKVKNVYFPWIEKVLENEASTNKPKEKPQKKTEGEKETDPEGEEEKKRLEMQIEKGLKRLSEMVEDPKINERSKMTSDSFYVMDSETIEFNQDRIDYLKENEIKKFSLIGGGAPETWSGATFEEMNPWRFSLRVKSGNGGRNAIEDMILAISEATAEEEVS